MYGGTTTIFPCNNRMCCIDDFEQNGDVFVVEGVLCFSPFVFLDASIEKNSGAYCTSCELHSNY